MITDLNTVIVFKLAFHPLLSTLGPILDLDLGKQEQENFLQN